MHAVDPSADCLHELIEAQARRTPEWAAVAFEGVRMTYRELDRRAELLARQLRSLGVGPDVLVGLLVERSVEMIVGILATLKAGGAYVPMETTYPPERIAFMLEDAAVQVVLTQRSLVADLPAGVKTASVICLDTIDWAAGEAAPLPHPAICAQPHNLAYVIYTSGSTGRPKGVGVEHRNIVSYVRAISERLELEPGMHHATVSTIAADLGNTVVFPALASGGCLHVVSQQRAESQALLAEYFTRERIDVLKIVPSHLAALQSGKNPEQVMPRRRLILGGEASRLDWVEQLRALAPACEIHNHYGPTETTVGALTYRVAEGDRLPGTRSGTLPLGKPLSNATVHVLDETGAGVASGEVGELYIGGEGVARGYLNRPDLTAEKFVAGRYRTGDLVRLLPDGDLEFCGRIDDQIKIHGYRVEPGEIGGVLREHGGVRDVVVLPRATAAGTDDKHLVAYVVPQRAEQPLWAFPAVHVLPDGMPVAHLNKNETDYIYNEIFVLQAYLRHGITIRSGDCVVDAGANIGLFSLFVSRLAADVRIHSFEPNPAAFACLQANAAATSGATCLPVGLSRDERTAELTFFEGLSLLSGFYADAATERDVVKSYVFNQQDAAQRTEQFASEIGTLIDDRLQSRTVTARLRTLSGYIAETGIDQIDLLKINVEKSELDVLQGIEADDWRKIRQLVIEVDLSQNLEPITSLLEQQGFDVLVEQDPLLRSTDLCYVYAIRPSPAEGVRLIREQAPDAHLKSLRPADEQVLTPATLRKYLAARIPHYMVPAAFVLLEEIPLTANGKIDRDALPLVTSDQARSTAGANTRPRTPTEATLAEIWTELLKVEHVGIEDDFFELGGHSLLAIQLVSRVRDRFSVDLPLRNLFEHPTLAALAEAIDALAWVKRPGGGAAPSRPGDSTDREEIAV